MHDRELLPLLLLDSGRGDAIRGRTRMQKLVFLLQEELEGDNPGSYRYEPYDYGPFSKDLYFDIDELVERDVIKEEKTEFDEDKVVYEYRLGLRAEEYLTRWSSDLKASLREKASEIKSDFNDLDLQKLLEYVYEEHPFYASESVL